MTPQQAEKVLSKMVNVQHFEQYIVKQYNQCVVDLLLYGNNTFSLDLYLKLANSPMNSGDIAHKMAMQFCLENINVETSVDYIPEPIEGYKYWAIDGRNGLANYFITKPKIEDETYHEWLYDLELDPYNKSEPDDDFNSEMYRHQWENGNWKNSLVCFEQEKYQPEPIEEYTHWAIDSDGRAFYYNFKPKSNNDEWEMSYNPSMNDCRKDDDFNSEMYHHQWQGNNWKNSLIEF